MRFRPLPAPQFDGASHVFHVEVVQQDVIEPARERFFEFAQIFDFNADDNVFVNFGVDSIC